LCVASGSYFDTLGSSWLFTGTRNIALYGYQLQKCGDFPKVKLFEQKGS